MTGLFQALGDFIDFLLTPIYNIILYFVNYFYSFLTGLLVALCNIISGIVSTFFYGLGWVTDRFFVNFISALSTLFPNGIISQNSNTNLVSQLTSWGLVGITWLQSFVDASALVTPIATYIGFLFCWGIYKLVKSWIPTVSG